MLAEAQKAATVAAQRSQEAAEAERLKGDPDARDHALDDLMAGRRPPRPGA